MNFLRHPWYPFLLLLLAFLSGNCKQDENNPVGPGSSGQSGAIVTGPAVDGGSFSVLPTGETITISKPGTPIDGLQVQVPAGAYPDTRTFQVSYAQVQSHQFGPSFNPVSPVIAIANGGGYAAALMTLKIPAKVPSGHFAMAFMYDPVSGELEGLPLIDADSVSVTVLTRHFAHSNLTGSIAGSVNALLARISGNDVGISYIIVSSIPEVNLAGTYDSPFQPGVDDWGFPNYGSIIAFGHCAGQSIGALWYYDEKRLKGEPPLWKRFDNNGAAPATPGFWQDDARAYKFCSVLQVSSSWNTWSLAIYSRYQHSAGSFAGKRTMNLFAYSLLLTHKPQLIYVLYDPKKAAHAILLYKTSGNTVYACDPNFPGATDRTFTFHGSYFDPYYSGETAGDPGVPYTLIEYIGVSAVVDWNLVAAKYQQMTDGTIGNDLFPAYTVKVANDSANFVPLVDGFTQHTGNFSFIVSAPNFSPSYQVYDESTRLIAQDSSFNLTTGDHRIGICVRDTAGKWAGFQWLTVMSGDTTAGPPVDFSRFDRLSMALIGHLLYSGSSSTDLSRLSFDNKRLDGAAELFSPVVWSGNSMSVKYTYTVGDSASGYSRVSGSMSGTVSPRTMKLVSLRADRTLEQGGPGSYLKHVDSLVLESLPLDTVPNFGVRYMGSGTSVSAFVFGLFHSEVDSSSQPYRETRTMIFDGLTSMDLEIFKQE